MKRSLGISFLLLFLAMPCASLAQTNQASWSNLSALRPGQKIQVVETNSKKHTGTFVNVSDTAIASRVNAAEQTIQKPEVRSIKLMENGHRMRHVLIGAGIGAGAGAGVTAAGWEHSGFAGGKGALHGGDRSHRRAPACGARPGEREEHQRNASDHACK